MSRTATYKVILTADERNELLAITAREKKVRGRFSLHVRSCCWTRCRKARSIGPWGRRPKP